MHVNRTQVSFGAFSLPRWCSSFFCSASGNSRDERSRAARRDPRADRFRKVGAGNRSRRAAGRRNPRLRFHPGLPAFRYRHRKSSRWRSSAASRTTLVDLVEPDEVFTAGEYRRRALEVLDDVRRRGRLPIITAGTGLYLRARCSEGLSDAPERSGRSCAETPPQGRVRAARPSPSAPDSRAHGRRGRRANRPPQDTQKIIRAIEMRVSRCGKPVGEMHRGRALRRSARLSP